MFFLGNPQNNNMITKKILLRFSVQRCSALTQNQGLFFKELKRQLISREVFFQPCEVYGLYLKCKSKKKTLVAYFTLEIKKGVVLTPHVCNATCLRCSFERRLQTSIGRLDMDKRFDINVQGQQYSMVFKSGKMMVGVGSDCKQAKPYKNKQKRLGEYHRMLCVGYQ